MRGKEDTSQDKNVCPKKRSSEKYPWNKINEREGRHESR